ncbi:cobalt ECF transporter T component CbiQ [Quadrisphaera sp. GCM10027208]|uniref:cobalt ECF transporter T component CbiQ n=1 Tax=Quadrisphaera sp. GCM10027208 TaxID=3273423 RepID=UPI00361C5D3E
MAAADGLLVPGDTAVHRLPAHVKVVALLGFVVAVVLVPPRQWWALLAAAAVLAVVVRVARLPAVVVVRRMVVEVPFVVFALLLPVLATGPRVDVLGVPLAVEGLVGAWNLLAKATIGVVAAITLAATTTPRDLVAGLERLRVPDALVQIVAFMLRYLAVVADDLHRMRIARESRGAPPGWWGQLRAVAATIGALFVRTYERGERVQQAMLARGWTGRSVLVQGRAATAAEWAGAAVLPLAAAVLAVVAWSVAG